MRRLPCHLRGPLKRGPRRSSVTGLRVNKANQGLTSGEAGHVAEDPIGEEGQHHIDAVGGVGRDDGVGEIPERMTVGQGLGVVTSSAAPAMVPFPRASTSASVSTCPPRATLTSQAASPMRSSCSAPMIPRVSGVSDKASTTTSASLRRRHLWRRSRFGSGQ